MMQFVTDFADAAVVAPLVLAVAVVMTCLGFRRVMLQWAVAVAAVWGAVLAAKAAWLGAAYGQGMDLVSPSGHTASACIVYGGLALLLLRGSARPSLAALVPLGITALIGYTRIATSAHTALDVVLGAAVGLAGLACLAWAAPPAPRLSGWPVLITGLTVLTFTHGLQLPAEAALRRVVLGH